MRKVLAGCLHLCTSIHSHFLPGPQRTLVLFVPMAPSTRVNLGPKWPRKTRLRHATASDAPQFTTHFPYSLLTWIWIRWRIWFDHLPIQEAMGQKLKVRAVVNHSLCEIENTQTKSLAHVPAILYLSKTSWWVFVWAAKPIAMVSKKTDHQRWLLLGAQSFHISWAAETFQSLNSLTWCDFLRHATQRGHWKHTLATSNRTLAALACFAFATFGICWVAAYGPRRSCIDILYFCPACPGNKCCTRTLEILNIQRFVKHDEFEYVLI